jgi:multidrug efflux pump subunit AcrA (membrane-fusion protein)
MTATVSVRYRRASILGDAILVPISAVAETASGEQVVWVIGANQTSSPRQVKLGAARGGQVEIEEGLQPGDRIATAGVSFLREDMKVRDLGDGLGGTAP